MTKTDVRSRDARAPEFSKAAKLKQRRFLLSSPPGFDPVVHAEAQLRRKPENLTKLRRRMDCRIKSIKSGNDEEK